MSSLGIGDHFPPGKLRDIDGEAVNFPEVFYRAPATVVFFYRGRDCQEDRPHIPLDPYPLRLLSDPQGELIRAVGAGREGHWSGFIAAPVTFVVDQAGIVRWIYTGNGSASDRPSPVALAKTAVTIAQGKEPADNQQKLSL